MPCCREGCFTDNDFEQPDITRRTVRLEKQMKRLSSRAVLDCAQVRNIGGSVSSSYGFECAATGNGQALKVSFWVIPTETVEIIITVNNTARSFSISSATAYFPLASGANTINVRFASGISDGQLILEKINI